MEMIRTTWCYGTEHLCRWIFASDFIIKHRRKFTTKKHKTWEDEGLLAVSAGYASLRDMSGRNIGRTACNRPLLVGSTLSLGGREIEIDSIIKKEDFFAGQPFLNAGKLSQSKGNNENPQRPAPAKPILSIKTQMKAQMLKDKENAKNNATKSAF